MAWLVGEVTRAESRQVGGEAWVRGSCADIDAAVSQPHGWRQLLTDEAALFACDSESIDDGDRAARRTRGCADTTNGRRG